MKKKAARIFTAFIMTAIIAQGTVMVASAAETDSTPDSVAVVEVATPDSSALESGADSTSVQPIADVIYKKWRRGSHGKLSTEDGTIQSKNGLTTNGLTTKVDLQ